MSKIYLTFNVLWRLLKAGKTLLLTIFITLSIILNIAQFTGNALASIFDTAIKTATGVSSASSRAKVKAARLTTEVSHLKTSRAALKKSITKTTKRMSMRTIARGVRVAAAGATQTAGSWVPYLGTATGAAFIAYEAYDFCQSFKELHELEKLVNLSETNDDYVFCGHDFNDLSKPQITGINSITFNGLEFNKIWFDVPPSIISQHETLFGNDYNPDIEYYFFIEDSKNGKKTRTWLVDLDYGPDDFYVSSWAEK